ncbi:MAG: substrate-binding domain-containing protein [Spirochaetota bacterium]
MPRRPRSPTRRKRRTNGVAGLLISDNSLVSHLLASAIHTQFIKRNIELAAFHAANDPQTEGLFIDALIARRAGGVIVIPMPGNYQALNRIIAAQIPLVVAGSYAGIHGADHVLFDVRSGINDAVYHLVHRHQKKNLIQLALKDVYEGTERRNAFEFALGINGIQSAERPVFLVEDTCTSGFLAMQKILSENKPVDAVICSSDYTAVGAIRAIADKKLSIPGDISVIGFYDTEFSRCFTPRMSTIGFDVEQFAADAAEKLLQAIAGTDDVKITSVNTRYIHRETS